MKDLSVWAVFCASENASWLTRPLFFYLADAEKRRDELRLHPSVIRAWCERLDVEGAPYAINGDPILAIEQVINTSLYGQEEAKPWEIVKAEILDHSYEVKWVGTRPIRVIHQVHLFSDDLDKPIVVVTLKPEESPIMGLRRIMGSKVASLKLKRLQDSWRVIEDPKYPDFPGEYLVARYRIIT